MVRGEALEDVGAERRGRGDRDLGSCLGQDEAGGGACRAPRAAPRRRCGRASACRRGGRPRAAPPVRDGARARARPARRRRPAPRASPSWRARRGRAPPERHPSASDSVSSPSGVITGFTRKRSSPSRCRRRSGGGSPPVWRQARRPRRRAGLRSLTLSIVVELTDVVGAHPQDGVAVLTDLREGDDSRSASACASSSVAELPRAPRRARGRGPPGESSRRLPRLPPASGACG